MRYVVVSFVWLVLALGSVCLGGPAPGYRYYELHGSMLDPIQGVPVHVVFSWDGSKWVSGGNLFGRIDIVGTDTLRWVTPFGDEADCATSSPVGSAFGWCDVFGNGGFWLLQIVDYRDGVGQLVEPTVVWTLAGAVSGMVLLFFVRLLGPTVVGWVEAFR